jgi:hypothetical protein
MLYEFQHGETGRLVDLWYEPRDVPRIGDVVHVDGAEYVRIPSIPNRAMVRRDMAHVSRQLDDVWRGEGPDPAPHRDEKGRVVFHSNKEIREFEAKTGHVHNEL